MTIIELIEKMKGFKYLEEILNQRVEQKERFFTYVILDNNWDQIEFSHSNNGNKFGNTYLSIYINCLINNDYMNADNLEHLPHMMILLDCPNENSYYKEYYNMLANKESIIKAYKRKFIIENDLI